MRVLDNIRQRRTQRLVSNLYDGAVQETVPAVMDRVFDEGFSSEEFAPVVMKNELFANDRPRGRKLSRYMKERRKATRKTYMNMTMVRSPYQYDRLDAFWNKESYFSRSLIRQVETMLRNGYGFSSDDIELLGMVKTECARIQMDSGMPLDQFIYSAALSLLKYGILIVHKVRERVQDDMAIDDKRKKRITRLRIIMPHRVMFYVNDKGRLIGIQDGTASFVAQALQRQSSGNRQFHGIPVEDLMIAYMSDPGDDFFPEPPCFQMLDDILTLRSIEETVELLAFQFGSPLLHARVGTDELPASPDEVRGVNAQLVDMAPNGMITTDHRTNIDVVNLQKGVTNLIPYLEHFKYRVLIGSGSSPISVGEGDTANRNTAESIDDALADHCTYLATAICNPINYNLIPDLLVKADTPLQETDLFDSYGELKIRLEFNEMRLEKQIARHNDVINLWQGNLITHHEARRILKMPPLTDSDEDELFVNMVQIPLKEAGVSDAEGAADSASSTSRKTKSQNQPANQHGTKAGPGSRKN